jgi:hypothetical protein
MTCQAEVMRFDIQVRMSDISLFESLQSENNYIMTRDTFVTLVTFTINMFETLNRKENGRR